MRTAACLSLRLAGDSSSMWNIYTTIPAHQISVSDGKGSSGSKKILIRRYGIKWRKNNVGHYIFKRQKAHINLY